MCFGNNKRQGDCRPQKNNYCGGFALDAVLTDGNSKDSNPIGTYENIQKVQDEKMINDSESEQFIKFSKIQGNGTVMLLPSSIAIEAASKDLEAMVYYDSSVNSSFELIIADELAKLKEKVTKIEEDNFWNEVNLKAADYFIVLVGLCHWVAVKKIDDNKFVCYDPDNGSCTGEEANILEAIKSAGYDNFKINSLVIALKKK